jgi:hypothetical protein
LPFYSSGAYLPVLAGLCVKQHKGWQTNCAQNEKWVFRGHADLLSRLSGMGMVSPSFRSWTLQEIPLSEEERAAVEGGIEAMEKLSQQLADVPTPAGPTPNQLSPERQETKTIIPLEQVRRKR